MLKVSTMVRFGAQSILRPASADVATRRAQVQTAWGDSEKRMHTQLPVVLAAGALHHLEKVGAAIETVSRWERSTMARERAAAAAAEEDQNVS